jgi:hypothetical protein
MIIKGDLCKGDGARRRGTFVGGQEHSVSSWPSDFKGSSCNASRRIQIISFERYVGSRYRNTVSQKGTTQECRLISVILHYDTLSV